MSSWGGFSAYVSADQKRALARAAADRLRAGGLAVQPVVIEGRLIASTFWGKAWCQHLESFSDYATRLPRGRSYARSGCIVHLAVSAGAVDAIVQGSDEYAVRVRIELLAADRFAELATQCAGKVASVVELLGGKLPDAVLEVVTDRERGLFPKPHEIEFTCDCPDHALMCKHVAAVLYGIGARLDREPELLFSLRGVDPAELVTRSVAGTIAKVRTTRAKTLPNERLEDIFGIELDFGAPVLEEPKLVERGAPRRRR